MLQGNIVVATDFSARADRAIDRARQLSGELGLGLRVVHAIEVDEAEGANHAALMRKMQDCVLAGPEDGIEFAFPVGSPPRALGRCGEADDVRLLVVGPARYNSLGDYVMGTMVDYTLRHTEKPVLIVKNRPARPYHSLIAATDFSIASGKAIIEAARMFPQASVHIVHGWRDGAERWEQEGYDRGSSEQGLAADMEAFCSRLAAQEPRLADATSQLVKGRPADAVRKGLELDPAGLVVMGSHGASGLRQAVIGSVVSDLLRQIDADALVVSAKAR